MIAAATQADADRRARPAPSRAALVLMLTPALLVVGGLFGGGLLLGVVQSLGHLPAAGWHTLSVSHFAAVLGDPDFPRALGLTVYVAGVSTALAGLLGLAMALALMRLGDRCRALQVVFQIPLTVPHLVIAVAVLFLLAPSGLVSRATQALGLIEAGAAFPLLVNDRWSCGIIAAYVWKEVPFITLMLLAVLRHGAIELLEVGRTLHAGPWQRLRYILLPLLLPNLGAALLIVFAFTFGAFEIPYLLGRTHPLALPVWAFKSYRDVDLLARPKGIAIGLIITLIITAAVLASHLLLRAARRRGAIL